jgi:uncharacterized protein (TIGR03086 family)
MSTDEEENTMDAPQQALTAVAVMTPLVHGTSAEALADPTPCREWTVRDLINHVTGGGYMFATCLRGGTVDPSAAPGDIVGDDHLAAYDAGIREFESALAATDDLSQPVSLPFATIPADMALRIAAADLLVHAWDLATATGQPFEPPTDFVESVTPFYVQFIGPELRDGNTFAAAVEPGPEASPIDRLVAYTGRNP